MPQGGMPVSNGPQSNARAPDGPHTDNAQPRLRSDTLAGRDSAELSALGEAVGELVQLGLTLPEIASRRGMPPLDSLLRWMARGRDLRRVYAQAAALRAEVMADTVVTIADAAAGESLSGAKLRMDARKWRVAQFRKDMDRAQAREDGADGGPVTAEVIRRLEEGAARMARYEAEEAEEAAAERAARIAMGETVEDA